MTVAHNQAGSAGIPRRGRRFTPRVHSNRQRSTEEGQLLAAALQGDFDAFGRLIEAHDNQMRALAYRCLGSRSLMDDALQIAYLKAFRNLAGFRHDAKFSTWLHRIVVNACYDVRVASERKRETSIDVADLIGMETMEDKIIQSDLLSRALQEVPFDQRVALVLVDGQGFSYDQAAEILGVENGTIASRLHRGRVTLRRLLTIQEENNNE